MSVLVTSFPYSGFVAGTALLPSGAAGLSGGAIPIVSFVTTHLVLCAEPPTKMAAAGVATGFAGIILTARPWESGSTVSTLGAAWVLAGTVSVGLALGRGALRTGLACLIYCYMVQQLEPIGASATTYLPSVVAVAIGAAVGEAVTCVSFWPLP